MQALILALAALLQADDGAWKAGFAAAKITPAEPIHLAGYASRNKPFEGVLADLWAKALALEDARGARAVLITTDLIGIRSALAEPVAERISKAGGIPRERILLSASHTHTGPILTLETKAFGVLSEEDARRSSAYTRGLQDTLVGIAAEALGRLAPAKLSWGWGTAGFVMNRREFTDRGVILGVNPRGATDRTVPVLRIDGADGALRGVLFGCACHNTTLTGEHYVVSGDYAGFAQEHVQKERAGAQAMFLQGCGGDANPYPRGTVEAAREHGATLGREVCRVLETKLAPVRGPLGAAFRNVPLPLVPRAPVERLRELAQIGPSAQREVFCRQLEQAERGEPAAEHCPAPTAVWQFGKDLTLVALSGEVVVDYAIGIERAVGPMRLWVSAYCNDVFGYLPSARMLTEGGYETRGTYSGPPGLFAPAAEATLIEAVRDLARQAGRPQ